MASDSVEPLLGIRTLRFANGVRLNLKRTAIEKDRVLLQLAIDGGNMLQSREQPLATNLTSVMAAGGLGKQVEGRMRQESAFEPGEATGAYQ